MRRIGLLLIAGAIAFASTPAFSQICAGGTCPPASAAPLVPSGALTLEEALQKIVSKLDLETLRPNPQQRIALSIQVPRPNGGNALLRLLTRRLASLYASQNYSGVRVAINTEAKMLGNDERELYTVSCSTAQLSDRVAIECFCSKGIDPLGKKKDGLDDEEAPITGALVEVPIRSEPTLNSTTVPSAPAIH